ncbi:hypothetical protein [Desulfonatronum thioautotrophicum]|uniref:hypothetical protein n=1 Tax=Desulfonatronum thioautotrophicum TaxID=617001 RepID=UPI0006996A38|nr:hypothetical protein [Desulfonatronum thioautotrophicum]
MNILRKTYYPGPSIMTLRPCGWVSLEAEISLHAPLNNALAARVTACLEEAAALQASLAVPVATTPAETFLRFALLAQQAFVYPVEWGMVRESGEYRAEVAFEVGRPLVFNAVAVCALILTRSVLGQGRAVRVKDVFKRFEADLTPRINHVHAFDRQRTAQALGVFIQPGVESVEWSQQIGQGRRGVLIGPGFISSTSHLGRELAGNKVYAGRCLAAHGLPTAMQLTAAGEENVVRAAEEIGYPVVLKPVRGRKGKDVLVALRGAGQVRAALKLVGRDRHRVLVEQFLLGRDYRLLVIKGVFAAAALRVPPQVVGDGVRSVRELISMTNARDRRHGWMLGVVPITVDEEVQRVLADQGVALDAVPETGRRVLIRYSATGESLSEDVTPLVHPDNRALAETAARACRLDLAGIDFNSPDISCSWKDNGAAIVEVNAGPAMDIHVYPLQGARPRINRRLIRACLPAHAPSRIPVIMVTGAGPKGDCSAWIANLLSLLGHQVGTPQGQDLLSDLDDQDQVHAPIIALLADRNVSAAVFEITPNIVAEFGLPVDRVAVTVLVDEQDGIEPAVRKTQPGDVLERVHHLAVDTACAAVVIDGIQAGLRRAVQHVPPGQVGYVWLEAPGTDPGPLHAHLQAGGWAVIPESGQEGTAWIMHKQGARRAVLATLPNQDFERPGTGGPDPRPALFACAALIGLGVSGEHLSAILSAALKHPVGQPGQISTLVLRTTAKPALAACDPRDLVALQRLRTWGLVGQDRVVGLAVEHASGIDPLDDRQIHLLEELSPFWHCAGSTGEQMARRLLSAGVPTERVTMFAELETAWESLLLRSQPEDLAILLSMDASLRMRMLDRVSVPALREVPEKSVLWTATELAECFGGSWVNGPPRGWGIDDLGLGSGTPTPDGLAVILGGSEEQVLSRQPERAVLEAFANGSRAVVAPLVPVDLPRWRPVLVCDDPVLGLERLARTARQRFQGLVVVFALAGEESLGQDLARVCTAMLQQDLHVFSDHGLPLDGSASRSLATALALARTPRDADLGLYCPGLDALSLGLLQPDVWVGVARTLEDEAWVIPLLRLASPDCKVFMGVAAGTAPLWRRRLQGRAHAQVLDLEFLAGKPERPHLALTKVVCQFIKPFFRQGTPA